MPQSKKITPKVEEVRPYLEGVAKNLVDKLYGPDGPAWGTTLTDIEDLILALRQILSEQIIDETLARQAAAHPSNPAARHCPSCRQPLTGDDTNERIVQTRVGEAQWAEPQAYCTRCRRAFFPSVQEPGHRSG
jgi:hypothetical protein